MNIRNLVFFKSDGRQIPIQYTNKITFTVIGNTYSQDRDYGWRKDAEGYIDVDENDKVISFTMTDGGSTFGFEEEEVENAGIESYENAVRSLVDSISFSVSSSSNMQVYTKTLFASEYNFSEFFDIEIGKRKIAVRSDVDSEYSKIYEYYIESITLKDNDIFTAETFIHFLTEDDEAKVYPSSQFLGAINMEPVSTELVSAITVFVLEKVTDENGNVSYVRPTSTTQNFRVEFAGTSDTKIVKYMDDYLKQDGALSEYTANDYSKAYWSNYSAFNLISDTTSYADNEPLAFTLGFSADEEGCYQDILSVMTVDNITSPDQPIAFNTIGYFSVKNETIGEDERYRTLFTNFGIPDPKYYPNLFKDMDILEDGTDWKFINKKSKELFLSYPEIFPYIGTYKALINAVKFLGYDDVYFKEWYKYFDGENATNLSYQSVDIVEGQTLSAKLKRVGVSLEEFLDWKKLNQLSLVYLLDKEDSTYDVLSVKDNSTGKVLTTKAFDIPDTIPVYTYLNNEVLAKLYALKEWLQKYIVNINCKIIDVTGEGVYFERYKEVAHPSPVYTEFDARNDEKLTPIFNTSLSNTTMQDSSAVINVSIKELSGSLKFTDVENKQISDYVMNMTGSVTSSDTSTNLLSAAMLYGATSSTEEIQSLNDVIANCMKGRNFENVTPFQSIKYSASTTVDCGTLRKNVGYYTKNDEENAFIEQPLLVKDNTIAVFDYLTNKDIELLSTPPIKIKAGRLRRCFGKWNKNTVFKIQGFFDTDRTKTRFCIQNVEGTKQEISDDYIALYPKDGASLMFTENNKYNVPMFIVKNYDTFDNFISQCTGTTENKFIVEVDEGFIPMDEYSDNSNGITCTAELHFEQDYDINNSNAQTINIKYIYETPNIPMDSFNIDQFTIDASALLDEYKDDVANVDEQISLLDEMTMEMVSIGEVYLKDDSGDSLIDKNDEQLEVYAKTLAELDTTDVVLLYGEEATKYLDIFKDTQFLTMMLEKQNEGINYNQYKDYYKGKIKNIQELEENNPSFAALYEQEMTTWKDKLDKLETKHKYNLEDYQARFNYIKGVWMSAYKTRKMNFATKFVQELENIKLENYQRNLSYDIKVNHTGEYTLTAYAVDGYNIPYVSTSNKTINVTSFYPTVIISDYKTREDGDVSVRISSIDSQPRFIPEYQRFVSGVNPNTKELTYIDYSYYLDNPKENEYLQISNTSERVDSIILDYFWGDVSINDTMLYGAQISAAKEYLNDFDDSVIEIEDETGTESTRGNSKTFIVPDETDTISSDVLESTKFVKISLNDETAGNQNPFYLGAETYIAMIDTNTGKISETYPEKYGPYNVVEFKPIPEEDTQEDNDNYLILGYNSSRTDVNFLQLEDSLVSDVSNGIVKPHLIVSTRLEIDSSNITNDYDNNTCTFKVKSSLNGSNLAFHKNQMIKIVYSEMTWNGYVSTDDGSEAESLTENWISETAYRISDAYYDYSDFTQTYVIDGLINTDLLGLNIYKNGVYNHLSDSPSLNLMNVPYKIRCSVAPCHQSYVDYTIKSTSDGDEDNTTGRISFESDWFADDYLDDTFAFRKRNFDVDEALDDWTGKTLDDVTYLNGFTSPISETPETEIHVCSRDYKNVYETTGYMSIWSVYFNEYKDKSKEILKYQVVNDSLDLCLEDEGEYRFNLTAIDYYGNKVDNLSDGHLKCFYGA